MSADLQSGGGADQWDSRTNSAVHEKAQPCVRGYMQVRGPDDMRLVLVRRVVGDGDADVPQHAWTDSRGEVEAAADGGEDPDANAGHRQPDDRDVNVDREDVLRVGLLFEDVQLGGQRDGPRELDLAIAQEPDADRALQPRREAHRHAARSEGGQLLGGLGVRHGVARGIDRSVGGADRDGARHHAARVGGLSADRERPVVIGDRQLRVDAWDGWLGRACGVHCVALSAGPLLDLRFD